MDATITNRCLLTTVKNISGVTKKFGFLPPHGKQLEANEEYSFMGSLTEGVTRGSYGASKRHFDALTLALTGNDDHSATLDVIETPAPVLKDSRTHRSQILVLNNDSLAVTNQCWDSE